MAAEEESKETSYVVTVVIWAVVCILIGLLIYWLFRPAPPTPPPPPPPPVPSPSPSPLPSPSPTRDMEAEAQDIVRRYYSLISQDDFREAYKLRSSKSRAETTYEYFADTWSNNVSIEAKVYGARVNGNRAEVDATLDAVDRDRKTGKVLPETPYSGTIKLVLENGVWRYDGFFKKKASR